jgi:hypothetical protein
LRLWANTTGGLADRRKAFQPRIAELDSVNFPLPVFS